MAGRLKIVENDSWLEPVEGEINNRYARYINTLEEIERTSGSIVDFANSYLYFGFQYDHAAHGWWFREWLPEAYEVYLLGDFNGWERRSLPLSKDSHGVWSLFLYDGDYGRGLVHGSLVKLLVVGANGTHERIPSHIRRVVQDDVTKDFTGVFWNPEPFDWRGDKFDMRRLGRLLIYEAHVGMATEREGIGTYAEFTRDILPRIKAAGYNTVQLMAIAEHPYYGSFGYHVSNFFAASSRFGTPEELKELIRSAHEMGLGVIMDLVQAHYVKNINEGLNELDGSDHLYSPSGEAGYQPYWDSKLFDYGKHEVVHFLLSNAKFWLDEFHFDGFRFDGVTSMIYYHHGYTEFDAREKYFDGTVNRDALCYLTLANHLVHSVREDAVTIAEDVSGMPGMCLPIGDGGTGFDYRLAMAIPDFWIRLLKEVPDQHWDVWEIWKVLTDRLPGVGTVAYCESHDQALVGDKTIAFRLMDKEMYYSMGVGLHNITVDRGMALHKMIRLITVSLGGNAYLDFMGNEFGHPEWIDFPREGNDWSYHYARRQWSLADDQRLKYRFLNLFDRAMIDLIKSEDVLGDGYAYNQAMDQDNQTMAFSHRDLLFVFNWHPSRSIDSYRVPVPGAGRYRAVLSTDEERFGGQGLSSMDTIHFSSAADDGRDYIMIYNVCRTAVVLKRLPEE